MNLEVVEKNGEKRIPTVRVVLWAALFLFLFTVVLSSWLFIYAQKKGPKTEDIAKIVVIPRGASVVQIGNILAQAELIYADLRFQLLAKITGLSPKLQAGEFRLSTGQKSIDILKELTISRPLQHRVTIVEGLRLEEIAQIFANGGWCEQDDFLQLVRNPLEISKFGLEGLESLEGYLFPDTYYLTRSSTNARSLITMMVNRFFKVWQELQESIMEKKESLRRHELVILASIVEKETGAPQERKAIASVFFNRLRLGMRLQSDPTVIYGIPNFSGNLTRQDLRTPSPYNTYTLPALPVGPICSPGRAALDAVLHPAEGNYLYFVSKNNGTHHFSKNLREHNRAVWKYQRGNNKKKTVKKNNT